MGRTYRFIVTVREDQMIVQMMIMLCELELRDPEKVNTYEFADWCLEYQDKMYEHYGAIYEEAND